MIGSFAHKVLAVLLTAIIMVNYIQTIIIVGDFMINQDIIAKTLCIQKDNQQGCNGKCHLKKQLAQKESSNNKNTPIQGSKRLVLDVFYVSNINSFFKKFFINPEKQTIRHYIEIFFGDTIITVDTPPPNLA